jgi:hypothetical protein
MSRMKELWGLCMDIKVEGLFPGLTITNELGIPAETANQLIVGMVKERNVEMRGGKLVVVG